MFDEVVLRKIFANDKFFDQMFLIKFANDIRFNLLMTNFRLYLLLTNFL